MPVPAKYRPFKLIFCATMLNFWNHTLWYRFYCFKYFQNFFPIVGAVMWATSRRNGCRSHVCIATSYLTSLNYNTSMDFLEIINEQNFRDIPTLHNVQFSERGTQYRYYKSGKVIRLELAGMLSASCGR